MGSEKTHRPLVFAARADSSRLESLLNGIAREIAEGRLERALRLADSACRVAPGDATCLLVHARLLIRSGAAKQAEFLLRGRVEPALAAARGAALCVIGQLDDAAALCEDLLARFAVDSVEGLGALASTLCRHPRTRFRGWVGVDTTLRLCGEVEPGGSVHIVLDDDEIHPLVLPRADAGLEQSRASTLLDHVLEEFLVEVPRNKSGQLSVSSGTTVLLGTSILWPPDFGFSGWVVSDGRTLEGKVHMDWSPRVPIALNILTPGGGSIQHLVSPAGDGSVATAFSIELDAAQTASLSPLQVSAVLPDGTLFPLAGSPVVLPSAPRTVDAVQQPTEADLHTPPGPRASSSSASDPVIDIIVPVYAGAEETLCCLESVFATTPRSQVEIIVINDASPDPDLCSALILLANEGRITLLTNPSNLGFPGAANRGMALHAGRDIVLLNADTELFGDWLERLRNAAYSSPDIGTATPLGEAASIVSYPGSGAGSFTTEQAYEIDRITRTVNQKGVAEVPVGVGFCMYIKRACLDATGLFRAEIFGRGYGEENDLCLRAARLGWRHVAATDVFVRHRGARSFGRHRSTLMERNGHVLNVLHPGYDSTVAAFIASDPLLSARRAIDTQRLLMHASRTVLLVTCALPGGVKRHVDLRRSALTSAGHTVVTLQPSVDRDNQVRLSLPDGPLPNGALTNGALTDLVFNLSEDLLRLRGLLLELNLEQIELHHFLGLPSAALELLVGLGIRYTVYVHDYSWICPRVSLASGDGSYCGEPSVEHCENCVGKHGGYLEESLSVEALRSRSARIMAAATRIVVPARDVHTRLDRYFPAHPMEIVAWEGPIAPMLRARTAAAGRVRVAVIGAISVPKGYNVLLKCAEDAVARDLDLEFVVIGYTCDDAPLLATGRVFITGPYADEEIGALLAREQCHTAFFPSVVPETWCYALSHALLEGLPVVAFDLGAIAERLLGYIAVHLRPLSSPAEEINDTLLRSAQRIPNSNTWKVLPMDPSLTPDASSNLNPDAKPRLTPDISPPADGFATSVQLLPLPEGVYTFTVKEGAPSTSADALILPAVQVGVAPTKFDGTVEFLSRGATTDRWLVNSRDMIIVKIAGGSASLMLTSMRTPDSPVLDINIQRLDPDMFSASAEQGLHDDSDAGTMLPAQILAHIHRVGDVAFSDGWAGSIGDRLWIEAFAIGSIGRLTPDLIEYCGLTADGYQTPWLGNKVLCGSRGRAIPMVGCAIRLKPDVADQYDCSYTGQFVSGRVLGPFRNGDLCCSDLPRDPLWGIELSATQRV